MSTNYIDNTVVSMKFDNRDFERNVHQSLGTIDKLKKSLDFKGAADSMEELSDTVEKTDLSPLLKGLSKATDGFSALEVMGITALSRITNKAMDVGEKLVKSLTIDQLSAGWSKYEQKINAVQTIMAATASTWDATARRLNFAGTQMEFVNEQLDKLNWFSDETSYSFTDMTSNIGKFTSAGVDLDKAVTAMEGISVWAAKSGVNAQDATRAYYNLAQAMSVGAVKPIDWRSIENVNMATIEFKQTAIDTAVKMGTLKKAENGVFKTLKGGEVTVTNFTDRLKDQWFSADVLTATLEEYGKAAVRLSEISDEYDITATEFLNGIEDWTEGNRDITGIANDLGIAVEELLPLFEELSSEEYKLSLSAFKAAQEAKTFTEVIEATKDAVSTQWMNTWELIFGNYEEAKELWSEMAEKFFDIFAGGGEARNNMLKKLLSDNWDALIQRINDAGIATDEFEKKLEENMRNGGVPVDDLLNTWGSLAEVFRNWPGLSHYVRETLLEMVTPLEENGKAVAETAKKLEDFQKVVNEVIRGNYKSGKDRVENLTKAGWDYAEVQDLVNKVWARNGQTWKDTTITAEDLVDTLGKMTEEELKTIGFTDKEVRLLQDLQGELLDTDSDINTFIDNLSNKSGRTLIFESLINIVDAFALAINVIKDAWNEVFPQKNIKTLRRYLEIIHSITEWLKMDKDTYDKVKRTLMGVFSIMGLIQDVITTALKIILPDLFTGVENVGGGILDVTANLGDFLVALRKFLTGGELLGNIIKYLRDMFFASVDGIKAFIEYLSELPIVGAVLEKIRDVLDKIVGFFKELWDIFYDSIIEENKTVFEALVKVFERLAGAFKDLEEKYPILKDIKEAIGNFFDAFKDYGGDILDGLIEGLSGFNLKALKDKVVELAEAIYNTFADWMGIHSPSTKFITLALNCVAGFIVGLIEGIAYVVTAVRNFAKGISDSTDKYIAENPDSPMAKLQNYIKIALTGIKDFFVDIFTGVQTIIRNIGSKLEDAGILKKLGDILKQMLVILWVVSIIYANIGITSAIYKIGEAFEGIGEFFESWGLKNYANIARNVAIAIAAIGFIAYLLAKLPAEQFRQAEIAVGWLLGLTVILSVLFGVLTKFNQVVSKAGKTKVTKADNIKKVTRKIQVAALILAIGGAIWMVADAIGQVKELISNNPQKFYESILWIAGVFALLVGAIHIIQGIVKDANPGSMVGAAAIVAVMAWSLSTIFATVYKYFFDSEGGKLINVSRQNVGQLIAAILSISTIIIALATAIGIMSKIGGKVNLMIGVGSALLGMAVGVYIITTAMEKLITCILDLSDRCRELHGNDNALIGALGVTIVVMAGLLIGLFAGLAVLTTTMKDNISGVFGLIAAAIFITALNIAVYNLVNCLKTTDDILAKSKNPVASILIVAGMLIGVTLAVKAINDTHLESKTAVWTLVGIATVIAAIGLTVNTLVEQKLPKDVNDIIGGLTGAISCILICMGLSNLLSSFDKGTAGTIIDKIVGLAGIALVLYEFGNTVLKLAQLDMTADIGYIMDQLKDFMFMLMLLGGALVFIQGQWGNSLGTFAVAALVGSMGWAIGQIGEGISILLGALTGNDWEFKLMKIIEFLTLLLLILGAFVGIMAYVTKECGGAVLAIAAVVAALGFFIIAIAALLAAITYFTEHETLIKMLKTVVDWIKDIVKGIQDAIDKLKEFFKIKDENKDSMYDADKYSPSDPRSIKWWEWFGGGSKTDATESTGSTLGRNPNVQRNDVSMLKQNSNKEIEKVEWFEGTPVTLRFSAGPTNAMQTLETEMKKTTKSTTDYLEQVKKTGATITSGVNTVGSWMGAPGAKAGSTGIWGLGDKVKSLEDLANMYGTAKEIGLTNPEMLKEFWAEFQSGELSDDSYAFIQNVFSKFGWDMGSITGMNFADGFSFDTEGMMKEMFGGQTYEEYLANFGYNGGLTYGQNFLVGFQSAEEEQAYGSVGLLDKATNLVSKALGGFMGLNGTDIQGVISTNPNYNIFAGYSGLGGFGTQPIEFPEKMEVTSTSLENTITSQMAMLRGQINTLKNDISNIYVRLDSATIVGKLTPAISSEIYGRTVQYGRGN